MDVIKNKLRNITKNCTDELGMRAINKRAKALTNFMNSPHCSEQMVKAIYHRFNLLGKSVTIIVTSAKHAKQLIKKAQELSTDKNVKIHNSLIQLGDDLANTNFNGQYHYRILFMSEVHDSLKIIDNEPIDADMIRKCTNTMLFTIDRYVYKRQAKHIKSKINKKFIKSLKHVYSSHDLIEKALSVLLNDYRIILIKCSRNTKDYGDYRQFVNDVSMLYKIKHSKTKQWSLKKEYIAYPDTHSKSRKTKSIKKSVLIHVKKDTMYKMTLKQILRDNKDTEKSDYATPADDDNIDYFWNLNDDVDVIDSILHTKSKRWVKDYICSDNNFINYAPVKDFKKHARSCKINKYGEVSSYGRYEDVSFPLYNRPK